MKDIEASQQENKTAESKHYDTLWHLCKDHHGWSAQVSFPVALTSQLPTRLAVTT